jgi:hypothetical protein
VEPHNLTETGAIRILRQPLGGFKIGIRFPDPPL